MRQWTAQVFLGHGNESLAWEGGHIHHATAQNHRIGIEQINAGGNGSWPRFQADSGRKGRFPHGRKDRSMGNFGAVVRTSVLAPFQSNWFPGTQNCHTRSVGSYLPGGYGPARLPHRVHPSTAHRSSTLRTPSPYRDRLPEPVVA